MIARVEAGVAPVPVHKKKRRRGKRIVSNPLGLMLQCERCEECSYEQDLCRICRTDPAYLPTQEEIAAKTAKIRANRLLTLPDSWHVSVLEKTCTPSKIDIGHNYWEAELRHSYHSTALSRNT